MQALHWLHPPSNCADFVPALAIVSFGNVCSVCPWNSVACSLATGAAETTDSQEQNNHKCGSQDSTVDMSTLSLVAHDGRLEVDGWAQAATDGGVVYPALDETAPIICSRRPCQQVLGTVGLEPQWRRTSELRNNEM